MTATLRRARPALIVEVLGSDARAERSLMDGRNAALAGLLQEHGYAIWHIGKSALHVHRLRRLDAFPSAVWTPETAEDYDYLFLPREREAGLLARIALPTEDTTRQERGAA